MRGHDDGVSFGVSVAHQAVERGGGVLIQPGIRLVHQQDVRIVEQGAGDAQALEHPARVGAHQIAARA